MERKCSLLISHSVVATTHLAMDTDLQVFMYLHKKVENLPGNCIFFFFFKKLGSWNKLQMKEKRDIKYWNKELARNADICSD